MSIVFNNSAVVPSNKKLTNPMLSGDKLNEHKNNSSNINSKQEATIKLNDLLFRLSSHDKSKLGSTSKYHQGIPKKPPELARSEFTSGTSQNFQTAINSSDVRKINSTNVSLDNSSRTNNPYTSNSNSQSCNTRQIFNAPSNIPTTSDLSHHQDTQQQHTNSFPSLKKFSAVAPPEVDHVVLMSPSEVVVMDTTDQSEASEAYNSILRPREKKIVKPSDFKPATLKGTASCENIFKSCQPTNEVLRLDESVFVEQYQQQSAALSACKVEPSPQMKGWTSQGTSKQQSFSNNTANNAGGGYGGVGNGGGGGLYGGVSSGGGGGLYGGVSSDGYKDSSSKGGGEGFSDVKGSDEGDYCNVGSLQRDRSEEASKPCSARLPVAAPRRTLILEQAERVKRLNSFFGEKKDSVTELESRIFNELMQKEEEANSHQSIAPTHSLPLESGSIRSKASESSNDGIREVVKSNLKNLNHNLNRSCENLLSSIANNSTISNIPSWKKRIMKGMKSHLKHLKQQQPNNKVPSLPMHMCPMSTHMPNVPQLVQRCTEVVERKGLQVVGVYRLPSKHAIVNQMYKQMMKPPYQVDWSTEGAWRDVACVTSLLKLFLRKLPEPLTTLTLYDDFMKASGKQAVEKLVCIRKLVCRLPATNHETLKHLATHLHLVASHASVNTMDEHNLATLFGPTLMHRKCSDTKALLAEMSAQVDVIENVIRYNEWVFSERPVQELQWQEEGDRHEQAGMQLLPNVETLLELAPSEEEEDEDDGGGSTFSFIRQHFFTRSSKSSRFFCSTDDLGGEGVRDHLSQHGSFKKMM